MNRQALFARTAQGIRPGLEMTRALLEVLDHPERQLKCIHVAGTNGKGSVCAMIESVLRSSGFKTGLYTSPHLFSYNERFRINGVPVPDAQLDALIKVVLDAEQRLPPGAFDRPATFFEISTVLAFELFRREQVDYAVIETGMGGRWDSTNVIAPLLSVITPVGMDHAEYLGDDLASIAREKAGIIKPGVPVVCGPMPVEAEAVLYRAASEAGSAISGSDETVFVELLQNEPSGQLLEIEAPERRFHSVRLPLGGVFQRDNCALAVAALLDLEGVEGIRLRIKEGLERTRWPGRFQMLQSAPPIVYDAAHNSAGAEALAVSLRERAPSFEIGFVIGLMKDKECGAILRHLHSVGERAWAITLPGERAMAAGQIAEAGRLEGMTIQPVENWTPALDWLAQKKKRLLCFTGSLYLAQELRNSGLISMR